MSGILALVARGAPPDAALLERARAALRPFGGDGAAQWRRGPAALAVEWLRTRARESQPPLAMTADGAVCVAADARIDDRSGLCAALGRAGHPRPTDAADAELVLAGYLAWAEEAPRHLLGDFAFAVWDAARQRLFCARDRFGVRPLFYALVPEGLVAASALDAVRQHPGVPDALDEQAVTDFLLAGFYLAPGATAFSEIRALPPGHSLSAGPEGVRVRPFWTLERGPELRYRAPEEYADHFRAVFTDAVADRAAGATTAVLMSGGRDSVSVAATLRRARPDERVIAFTTVYDWLLPDEDRRYAALAARALGVEHRQLPVDDHGLFTAWVDPSFRTEQPAPLPRIGYEHHVHAAVAGSARVVLTGQGADAVLRESRSWLARLLLRGRWLRAGREALGYARIHRRLPRPGVRSLLRQRGDWRDHVPPLPAWLRPDAVRRLGMEDRWAAVYRPPGVDGGDRAEALDSLRSALWVHHLAVHHPPIAGVPLETAHPFLDLRVVRFLLAVPPAQWYNDKGLLRMLLRGALPAEFLRRQKAWMAAEPLEARMRADGAPEWRPPVTLSAAVEPWVRRAELPAWAGGDRPAPLERAWLAFFPLCLSLWMDRTHSSPA